MSVHLTAAEHDAVKRWREAGCPEVWAQPDELKERFIPGLSAVASPADLQRSKAQMQHGHCPNPPCPVPPFAAGARNPSLTRRGLALAATAVAASLTIGLSRRWLSAMLPLWLRAGPCARPDHAGLGESIVRPADEQANAA